jgi:hypothetical protein
VEEGLKFGAADQVRQAQHDRGRHVRLQIVKPQAGGGDVKLSALKKRRRRGRPAPVGLRTRLKSPSAAKPVANDATNGKTAQAS